MDKNKCLEAIKRRADGRSIDVDDVMLALFSEPECADSRRWAEVFERVSAAPPPKSATGFIARALREQRDRPKPEIT